MKASPHWTLSHWSKFLPVCCSGVVLLSRCVHHLALTYSRSGSIVPRACDSHKKRKPNGMLLPLSGQESLFQSRCCYACVQVTRLMTLSRLSLVFGHSPPRHRPFRCNVVLPVVRGLDPTISLSSRIYIFKLVPYAISQFDVPLQSKAIVEKGHNKAT